MAPNNESSKLRQWWAGMADRVGSARQRAAAFTRHHGALAPGVRLLRNLDLRAKALLLAVCIGIPVAVLLAHTWRHDLASYEAAGERERLLLRLQGLDGLARSSSQLLALAIAAEIGQGDKARWQAALQVDQATYQAFAAGLQDLRSDRTMRVPIDALQARRDALLALAGNESPRGVPGFSGPRVEALSEYARELTALRRALGQNDTAWAAAPAPVQALHTLHIGALQRLHWLVGRAAAIGAPVYESEGRTARGERLQLLMLEARLLGEGIELELRQAVAHGLVAESVLQQDWPLVRQQIEQGLAIAQAARFAHSAGEVTAGAGADRRTYLAAARAAVEAGDRIETATLDSLTQWSRAHWLQERRALAFEALLVGSWLVLAMYLLVCTYKVLQGGLATLCNALESVGRGDLTRQPQGHGRDEIGRALNALSGSTRNMAQLFGAVTQGVAAVSHASREVAGGNAGLTNRTADVQQLVHSVTERARACSDALVSSGTQVEQAAELIRSMQADAGRSRKAMGALGEGMARLQVKSREIDQVVGLVESVAYQTKLLSINASVEAARAGPAGRGFAVVAHEVRALAQRSEQAAHRIGGIVNASIEEIRSSSTMAERASEAVRRNDEKMARVDTLMSEAVHLTRAGRGEAQEVSLIARNVGDSMAGNVRVVDQLADASAWLREQGDSLKRSVQHFVFG